MANWTTTDLQQATGGDIVHHGRTNAFSDIRIDSRAIDADAVFVAIEGTNHDGHTFIGDVLQQGVRAVVLASSKANGWIKEIQSHGVAGIAVEDTTAALGRMGAFHRKRCRVETVAVTGSNGKTTTRCMVAGIFQQRWNTLATSGNLNNEIGVPLTLFRLAPEHEWAVLELGMNHPGEIRRLGHISSPRIGIITNVAPAHLEGLGSLEGVLQAKAELLETIENGGAAILNADDPQLLKLSREAKTRVVLFGVSDTADVRAVDIETTPSGTRFEICFHENRFPVQLHIPGKFMVSNALAAAAAGFQAGLSPEEIQQGLERFTPESGRMQVIRTGGNFCIIDDTYNANPGSMAAALDTLSQIRGRHRSIFVAGDMLELGPQAAMLHRDVGRKAATSGVALIFATGKFAAALADGAISEGFDKNKIVIGRQDEILKDLLPRVRETDWVLVKGSRGMKMETIVAALQNEADRR